ncbi:hypothetical protein GCK72_011524 [Caenorhabditis remanei]|uniref:Uncharacterized protein n=1 Tax=Caenorhabditis remanei TaxID=31234 RepID=A0A6A5H689_CAERE|nr:hypothetical protein GCK72_011524 [Caenorhabditis remanei]KAF1763258.1 hypothetical protein GCK72_011524 [Caenorhabditis remanei]
MKKILFFLLLLFLSSYGFPIEESENKNSGNPKKSEISYATEIVENPATDKITDISGNPKDAEVIDGKYGGGSEKTSRVARQYYYYPSYGYGYGYGYGFYGSSRLIRMCMRWVWGCSITNYRA